MPHISSSELKELIKETEEKIPVGSIWPHYKHPEQHYKIEFIGCWENTDEVCVGYRAMYGEELVFVRTVANFLEIVEVSGQKIGRFAKVK